MGRNWPASATGKSGVSERIARRADPPTAGRIVVLDASAAVPVLLNLGPLSLRVSDQLQGAAVAVPELFDSEVLHAVRKYWIRGEISDDQFAGVIDDLEHARMTRHRHLPLLGAIWKWRHNVSAADALYLGLAQELGADLVTCDGGFSGVPGSTAKVVLVQ